MTYKVLGVLAILAVFVAGNAAMALEAGVQPGSLGDRVWWDYNKDGIQDGVENGNPLEPGMDGATVELYNSANEKIATDQTDAAGYYLFTGLSADTYTVKVTPLRPSKQTYDLDKPFPGFTDDQNDNEATRTLTATAMRRWAGETPLLDNDGNPVRDSVGDIVYVPVPNPDWNPAWTWQPNLDENGNPDGTFFEFAPNGDDAELTVVEEARDVDFGYVNEFTANFGSIGDYVWNDWDKDGVQDAGEPGIPGALVRLVQDTNGDGIFDNTDVNNVTDLFWTTYTDAGGLYLFSNLALDFNYQVTVLNLPAPAGGGSWKQTYDKDDGLAPFVSPNRMFSQPLPEGDLNDVRDVDFGYIVVGRYFTYTQGGWGAPPRGSNPGMLLKSNWTSVYGLNPLVVGSGPNKITLTTALAVQNFLPQGGTAGKLIKFYNDPLKTSAGVFAGQVTALKLSVLFSDTGRLPGGLGDLKIISGPLASANLTARDFLALCENALSGYATGYTIAQLNEVATAINENFDNGTTNNGYLAP